MCEEIVKITLLLTLFEILYVGRTDMDPRKKHASKRGKNQRFFAP